jgi:cytochrome c biogenesis protein CcmG, thiol:disulfide interchange protein DsbE
MKRSVILLCLIALSFAAYTQIPAADVENLEGKKINTQLLSNDGNPMVISFWATWCKPCVKELNAISEIYDDWKKETGVKVVAISIDNARSKSRVAPFVSSQNWEFEVLLDPNGDFKRVMNVVNVPHTFLIDGKGNIVYQHTSYADGDEEKLFQEIKKLVDVKK